MSLRALPEFLRGIACGLRERALRRQASRLRRPVGERLYNHHWSPRRERRRALLLLGALGGLSLLTMVLLSPSPQAGERPHEEAAHEAEAPAAPGYPMPNRGGDPLTPDPDAPAHEWTSIVLHHSATTRGSATSFDAYHRQQRGWRSLGYHFVIGNGTDMPDGEVEAGPRWRRQEAGAHANSNAYNTHGIGICLVGNFELAPPSETQLQAVVALCRELCARHGIPPARIFGHGEIRAGGSTVCPGKFFPLKRVRNEVSIQN